MAAERDLELLDDYLANRMDEPSRAAFEKKLNADQELRSEMQLQQQMISGIKQARVAELKAMLSNVAVPGGQTSGAAVGTKVALWVAVAGLVATGVYLYIDKSTADEPTPSTEQVTPPADQQESPSQQPADETKTEVQPHEDSPGSSEESASESKPIAPPKPGKKSPTPDATKDIEVFDPTEEMKEENDQQIEAELNASRERAVPSIAVEVESGNKKYNFHYQFKEGKLFLYGPFETDLYEIMEFFSEEKRTLFLFYKDNFYLLKDNSTSLKPLNAIQDPELITKLKEYRNK